MSNLPSDFERQGVKQRNNWKNNCRDTFGDIMKKKKKKNNLRVVFQNINGLMIEDEAIDKREIVKEFIKKYNVDFMALAEVNVNWNLVKRTESLHTKSKEWFENPRVVTAHNTIARTNSQYQPGDVAIISAGDLSL